MSFSTTVWSAKTSLPALLPTPRSSTRASMQAGKNIRNLKFLSSSANTLSPARRSCGSKEAIRSSLAAAPRNGPLPWTSASKRRSFPAFLLPPRTRRGISQGFAVITGHCREGLAIEWSKYANIDTLVILMGVQNRVFIAQSLISAGRSPSEPVAFIERGTQEQERIVISTLEKVARGEVEVSSL